MEDFSADAVRSQIAEAQKIVGGSGSEQDIAEAKIELEVSFGYSDLGRGYEIRTNEIYRFWRPCKHTSSREITLLW